MVTTFFEAASGGSVCHSVRSRKKFCRERGLDGGRGGDIKYFLQEKINDGFHMPGGGSREKFSSQVH